MIAYFEALSELSRQGFRPRRSVLLAIGHDEEVGGGTGGHTSTSISMNPCVWICIHYIFRLSWIEFGCASQQYEHSNTFVCLCDIAHVPFLGMACAGAGATAIAAHLRQQGRRLALVWDEGMVLLADGLGGLTSKPTALVGTAEKVRTTLAILAEVLTSRQQHNAATAWLDCLA